MTGLIILGVVAALAAFILLCVFLPAVGLTILGIIVLLIVLVLNVPVGADAAYIGGEFTLAARANGFSFQILPKKSGSEGKPPKENKPKKEKKPKPEKESEPKPKKKLSFTKEELFELAKRVLKGVGKFGKVTVNKFMLHYAAAGDDPYDTVVTYNYVNAALSTLIPICEEKFIVKDSDIRTDIDFTVDKTKVDVELCATIRLAQVMHMLFAIAFGALGVLIQNKRRLRREKKQGIASDGIEVDVALEKDTDEAETSQINKGNNTEQNTQAEERTDSNGQ